MQAASSSQLRIPELLAPAGDWECAKAAVENGADAIYFGLEQFNARMRAKNFTEADLPELMTFLHQRGVKGYVTFNTLVFPAELAEAEAYIRAILAAGVDAAIVQDVGVARLIRHLSPDFPIHASTQMTVTSAAGVEFARELGCQLVVLARECSLKEIRRIRAQLAERGVAFPLEVFVHGALCVAYSGQCLTSEALGGRSANRGECAQACRMPYELICDGQQVDLGERRYLLSPQDLAGLEVLPELVASGVTCLKVEGRLKAPEYVATVTKIYRDALDRIQREGRHVVSDQDRYELEMSFSRGLSTGWMRGIDNQALVHARFGKKRGVYLGEVTRVEPERVTIRLVAPLKPGDGLVFDDGYSAEQGGRVYAVDQRQDLATLKFGRGDLDLSRIRVGTPAWKTSDPELERRLRQTAEQPQFRRPIDLEVHGAEAQRLTLVARDEQGHVVRLDSAMPLQPAHSQPLSSERLRDQLGRLGNTPFSLRSLDNHLIGSVLLPLSELNRLRREMVQTLVERRGRPRRWQTDPAATLGDLLPAQAAPSAAAPELIALVRRIDQLRAAVACRIPTIYCEFEDPRAYRQAVQWFRAERQDQTLWVAPPRISKPGENWILQQVLASQADGYLIRNYDHLSFFAGQRCIGDFSLNIANPLTAAYFKERFSLERLTASYDLNIAQLGSLLKSSPPAWYEVTIHQHMPLFHMEHCVFCAFLSEGNDHTNCGRPCEQHAVKLRDRVGSEHVLKADAGCRNTLFNGRAQTGAEYVHHLVQLGLRHLRVEFVDESPEQVASTLKRYQQLLDGEISGSQLWRELKLHNQLGVTRGQLENH